MSSQEPANRVDAASGKKIYTLDRTGAEQDDGCGAYYFWNRVYRNPALGIKAGIVPRRESIYLQIGRESHEDLAMVAEMDDIRPQTIRDRVAEITSTLTDEDRIDQPMMEVLYRRLGWLSAFALYIEPELRERYETLHIEDEIILDREPLWVPVTPDRVMRDRKDGKLVYWEWKSTKSTGHAWTHSWQYAIQLHIGMAAIGEELKESVKYAQVVGLYKGYDSQADGGLNHTYVWGWRNTVTQEWTHEYAKSRGGSWERAPVWEFPGGIVTWVQKCGPDVAKAQFPMSPPVTLNSHMLERWVQRKTTRAKEVDIFGDTCQDDEKLRNHIFPAKTRMCRPAFGDACPYIGPCWNAVNGLDPMRTGDFIARVPHHEIEVLALEEKERQGVRL